MKVVKINTDKYPKLASQYDIQSLPTSILCIEGEQASRIKGVMQTPKLIEYLKKFL
ncbi:thioredoxin family protein [Coleofasciculus sp.]|uniref:thioredoxin family protein n=1 Tax=Coleofasciculus sp. TaxID=3100458 RepID=UPI003A31F365